MKAEFIRSAFFLSSIALVTATSSPSFGDSSSRNPRGGGTVGIMNEIFTAVTRLMPMSFDPDQYRSQANRKSVLDSLSAIEVQASRLEQHGQGKEAGFQGVSKSFAMDIRQIRQAYQSGDYQASRFHLHRVVDRCVSCHSRLPEGKSFPIGAFYKEVLSSKLPPLEKVRLQVAVRQFDRALDSLDRYFDATDVRSWAHASDAFETYFKVALRVKKDHSRALKLVRKLSRRADLPRFVQENLQVWSADLMALEKSNWGAQSSPNLAYRLIENGRAKMKFGTDRSSLVNYTAASAILHGFVSKDAAKADSLAKAYYHLGLTELIVNRSFWVSEARLYLETAIRKSPGSSAASDAFAVIEEQVYLGFSGSAGINIPDDIQKWVNDLKSLISSTKTTAKSRR